ncbi:MAG TPA: hypothetical protein VF618_13065 [Thermoanaerobaculia bacterium]
MTRSRAAETLLILGGAGMVGEQVAREAARELRPKRIVIAALSKAEVDEAITRLDDIGVELVAAPGNIFLPQSLQGIARDELISKKEYFDELFAEVFSPTIDFRASALFQVVDRYKPDVIVDCINTATAISYQAGADEFNSARRTKALLDAVEGGEPEKLPDLIRSVRELLVSQGVPQITRHLLFLQRTLEATSVRVYVKVGTTGTGGMGINIPYTHSEDKPSLQLLAKSAIGFAHTGLLFLLARTPSSDNHGTIIKEVKPGAMIGFKRLGRTHVKLSGKGGRQPAYLVSPKQEPLGETLVTQQPPDAYERFDGRDVPLEIIGADTGENGFFSIGEFQAITYPRQMEYVTPEEVARTAVLEILGASTGRDVLSAIDGAITEPSYRAGVLRERAIRQMKDLEQALEGEVLPSIAVGHLGPPKLSKLLAEAYLLLQAGGTKYLDDMVAFDAEEWQSRVESYLARNPRVASTIITIGIPMLREADGKLTLTRGPRVNIPPLPHVPLDADTVDKYARTGWVDLRRENFEVWVKRIAAVAKSRPDIATHGSAAFDLTKYPSDKFVPGDVVGWLFTTEIDEQGMVGHRLF